MRDPVSLEVTLTADCPACQQPSPLHGLLHQQPCATCLTPIVLEEAGWRAIFDPQLVADLVRHTRSQWRDRVDAGGLLVRARLRREPPACPACAAPIAPEALEEAARQGAFPCSCGNRVRLRPATDLSAGLLPGAQLLVGEEIVDAALEQGEALSIACSGCGGSLPVDSRSPRTIRCTFCEGSNFLPDNLWFRIRPRPVTRPFYLLADLAEADTVRLLAGDAAHAPLIASREDAPEDVLRRLCDHKDVHVRAVLAGNRSLPAGGARALSRDRAAAVREALAGNPAAGAALSSLAADAEGAVRAAVAANPTADEAALAALAQDPEPTVRVRLLDNPRAPLGVIVALARVEDSRVVLSAMSRSLPEEVLWVLSESPHPAARKIAAGHADTPDACLLRLSDDPSVADVLYRRPSLPPPLIEKGLRHPEPSVRLRLAGQAELPEQALVALAGDADHNVAAAIARRGGLTAAVLAALAESRSKDARRAAARGEALPEAAAVSLAETTDYQTRMALLDRPALPEAAVLAIATDKRMDVRKRLARHASFSRSAAALKVLAQDPDVHLQKLLQKHPAHAALQRRRLLVRAVVGAVALGVLGAGGLAALAAAVAMGWVSLP